MRTAGFDGGTRAGREPTTVVRCQCGGTLTTLDAHESIAAGIDSSKRVCKCDRCGRRTSLSVRSGR